MEAFLEKGTALEIDTIKSGVMQQREFYLDSSLFIMCRERLSRKWSSGQHEEEAVKNSWAFTHHNSRG